MGNKGDKTKRHIQVSAFELFAVHGYTKVSMQDICDKSELSKGGLYRHYDSKCRLFTDILRTMQKEEAEKEAMDMEQGVPATKMLNSFLDRIKQDLNKDIPNINIALYEFCVEYKDGIGAKILSGQYEKGHAILLSLVEYGISRHEFYATNPDAAVSTILFLVEGLKMTNEVMPISNKIITDILNQIKEILGAANET